MWTGCANDVSVDCPGARRPASSFDSLGVSSVPATRLAPGRASLKARDSSRSRPSSPLQLCHPLGTSTQAQENIKNRYDLKGCDTGRALLDVHLFVGTKRSSGIWSTYLHVSTLSGLTALLVAHRELKTDLENSFVE